MVKIKKHISLDPKLNAVIEEAARRERRSFPAQLEVLIEAGIKALGLLAKDTEQRSEQFVEAFTGDKK